MNSYFCSTCGKSISSANRKRCRKGSDLGLRIGCCYCNGILQFSGGSFIVVAIIIFLAGQLVLDDILWRYASILAGPMFVVGILRLLKMHILQSKYKPEQGVEPDGVCAGQSKGERHS
jgi:hypothetical protein